MATQTMTYVTKVERYDEDIMMQMLVDTRISSDDRKRLSHYFRHSRITPSKATVSYERGKNFQDIKMGRLYPVGGMGLQSFRRDIRTPLLSKYYWDVDFENCHYNIALKFARDYGLSHKAIQRYCTHRDECLALYSDNRVFSKNAYLKIAYGGDLSLYRDDYDDTGIQNPKTEAHQFIRDLKQEMETLAEIMYIRHPELHKVKCGKENKPIEKRNNNRAVLLSLILQNEEEKCLVVLDDYMTSMSRYMGLYIHDGGAVEKQSNELEFPEELLVGGAKAVFEATGYSFKITSKSMSHQYEAPAECKNEYAKMKASFEKRNFLIGATLNCITEDGIRMEYKIGDATIKFSNLKVNQLNPKTMEVSKEPFLKIWLQDENRRDYERCDFIPNRDKCPESVFNLFNGFAIEEVYKKEISSNGEITKDEMMELITPIRNHISVLTDGQPEFTEKWLANILQEPDIKSDVGMLYRDVTGLLDEGGGTGKDTFFDWFGTKIVGEKYYVPVDDNSVLYGNFNSLFEGKILVYVQEANGKDNHANSDVLKSKITKKRAPIRKKNVAEYEVNDYARFACASNGVNPIPNSAGDRRWAMHDVLKTFRSNREYFVNLYTAMENVRVQCAFYLYLNTLSTYKKAIDFQINRPITSAYIDIRRINAPAHMKWLCYELRRGTLPTKMGTRELYARFRNWYERGNREASKIITETSFGKLMKDADLSEHHKTSGIIIHSFDYKKLIDGLVKLHQLNEGECKLDESGHLMCIIEDEDTSSDIKEVL